MKDTLFEKLPNAIISAELSKYLDPDRSLLLLGDNVKLDDKQRIYHNAYKRFNPREYQERVENGGNAPTTNWEVVYENSQIVKLNYSGIEKEVINCIVDNDLERLKKLGFPSEYGHVSYANDSLIIHILFLASQYKRQEILTYFFNQLLDESTWYKKMTAIFAPDTPRYQKLLWASITGQAKVIREIIEKKEFNVELPMHVKKFESRGATPLIFAARFGHLNVVQELLKATTTINATDEYGRSALFWALAHGHVDVAVCLIEHGADVDQVDKEGKAAIEMAAGLDFVGTVELLFNVGAKIDDAMLHQLLGEAVKTGDLCLAKVFVKRGADINKATGKDGRSSIHYAAIGGWPAILSSLIGEGTSLNQPDNDNKTPLYLAVENKSFYSIKMLLEHDVDTELSANGKTPLQLAVELGSEGIVSLFLTKKVDINARVGGKGQSLLQIALSCGRLSVAGLLINKGADINQVDREGNSPLHDAAARGDLKTLKFILKNDGNPHCAAQNGLKPIDIAMQNGHKEICRYLKLYDTRLSLDQRVQGFLKREKSYFSGLFSNQSAVERDFLKDLKKAGDDFILIQAVLNEYHKSNPEFLKKEDIDQILEVITPLFHAVDKGLIHSVAFLLKRSVETNTRLIYEGPFLLYIAAVRRNTPMLNLLIKNGADINRKGANNERPLFTAVNNRQLSAVICLLRNGADPTIPSPYGERLIDIATKNGDIEMCSYLNLFNRSLSYVERILGFLGKQMLTPTSQFTLMKDAPPEVRLSKALEGDIFIVQKALEEIRNKNPDFITQDQINTIVTVFEQEPIRDIKTRTAHL